MCLMWLEVRTPPATLTLVVLEEHGLALPAFRVHGLHPVPLGEDRGVVVLYVTFSSRVSSHVGSCSCLLPFL